MSFEKVCVICGKSYNARKSNSKTCSSTCRVKLFEKKKMTSLADAGVDIIQEVVEQTYLDPSGKAWKSKEERIAYVREISKEKLKVLMKLKAEEIKKLKL